ncbi:MAG: FAD-dependent monooxygenase, partial [Alphaproteobacteria bacterium]|nr:FAD-dependent monooxygenase [Alphaproteobacteria bacterium]
MEDVIIIGGGPVGFVNALGLAQAGVRLTLLEAEPRIIDSPRAAV